MTSDRFLLNLRWCRFVCTLLLMGEVSLISGIRVNFLSDIHYDPAYGTGNGYVCRSADSPPFGKYSCDSPEALLNLFMEDAAKRNSSFTLYGGDFQRHDFDKSGSSVEVVFGTVAEALSTLSPPIEGAPSVVSTMGNNDLENNYVFNWKAPHEPGLEKRVDSLVKHQLLTVSESAVMTQCGYYVRETPSLNIVVLHTLVWTYRLTPVVPESVADPCGQMAFLSSQLVKAKREGKKVFVLGHIPPILTVYEVTTRGFFSSDKEDMYWKPVFREAYFKLMKEYEDIVVVQLYGHIHMFSQLVSEHSGSPVVVLPSISPIFGNEPSYLVGEFDEEWNLQSLYQRYLDRETGEVVQGMNLVGAIGLPYGWRHRDYIWNVTQRYLTDAYSWNEYRRIQSGGVMTKNAYTECNDFCRAVVVCSQLHSSYEAIKQCVSEAAVTSSTIPVNASGSIVTSVLILGCVAVVCGILIARYWLQQNRFKREFHPSDNDAHEETVEIRTFDPFDTTPAKREVLRPSGDSVVAPREEPPNLVEMTQKTRE